MRGERARLGGRIPRGRNGGDPISELKLLEETVAELFACEADAWARFEEAGLARAAVDAGLEEAATIVRLAGRFAAPGPVAETVLLGAWLAAEAGLEIPEGPLTAVAAETLSLRDGVLSGTARRVPWARRATLAVLAGGHVALARPSDVVPGENVAGEPRDDVRFDGVAVEARPVSLEPAQVARRGALARALAMAGALERVLELTVRYACEREQFGRPIARFQAIQQQVAILAGEVAAARAAADAAVELPDALRVAAAKVRTGEAATRAAEIAHQVHGAIGYTDEHELHRFTLRLWAWRDEFGSEEEWAVELGRLVAAAPDLWLLLTGEED